MPGRSAFALAEADVPAGVLLDDDSPQNVIYTPGEFFFRVAEGSGFGLYVSGSSLNERVRAELRGPDGMRVWESDSLLLPKTHRVDSARGGLWTVRMSKPSTGVLEDYYIDLVDAQPVLFLNAGRYW